jgi:hypothetical protein
MTPLAAMQAALTVEHQVVYGYGVVGARMGGHTNDVTRDECVARLDAHRTLRDELADLVRTAGGVPVAGAPAYNLPFPVQRRSDAAHLGAVLEDAVTGAMWDLIVSAATGTGARRLAVRELAEAAGWAARWRGSAWPVVDQPALPGQPQIGQAQSSQPSTSPTSSSSVSTTPSGSTS